MYKDPNLRLANLEKRLETLGCRVSYEMKPGLYTITHLHKPEITFSCSNIISLEYVVQGMEFRERCAVGQIKAEGKSLFMDAIPKTKTIEEQIQAFCDEAMESRNAYVNALGHFIVETQSIVINNPEAICVVSGFEGNKYITRFEIIREEKKDDNKIS